MAISQRTVTAFSNAPTHAYTGSFTASGCRCSILSLRMIKSAYNNNLISWASRTMKLNLIATFRHPPPTNSCCAVLTWLWIKRIARFIWLLATSPSSNESASSWTHKQMLEAMSTRHALAHGLNNNTNPFWSKVNREIHAASMTAATITADNLFHFFTPSLPNPS